MRSHPVVKRVRSRLEQLPPDDLAALEILIDALLHASDAQCDDLERLMRQQNIPDAVAYARTILHDRQANHGPQRIRYRRAARRRVR